MLNVSTVSCTAFLRPMSRLNKACALASSDSIVANSQLETLGLNHLKVEPSNSGRLWVATGSSACGSKPGMAHMSVSMS